MMEVQRLRCYLGRESRRRAAICSKSAETECSSCHVAGSAIGGYNVLTYGSLVKSNHPCFDHKTLCASAQ